ncbi:uncharacterized protein PB18E9.04c [Strongylocentrotus purpuratus]|uniref:Uncharacterized protein n=1 Tax=Strongylocentrotus purpuratus TaxID=7668 RepID=A0A7M7NYI6_STRPU|nr:uncharacterized protein PB18E9.04c [Strongylocentrotus purpuratus]
MANQRRIPVNNADEDIEGQDPRYTVREAIPMDPFHLENGGKPPSPPVSPVRPPERPDGGHPQCSFPNGLNNGHPRPPLTHDEPLYATVNKTGNLSKTVAADLQRPTSSSGHCHKNVVCKTMCKVLNGRRKGAGKKETEPGSVVEKGRLLSPGPEITTYAWYSTNTISLAHCIAISISSTHTPSSNTTTAVTIIIAIIITTPTITAIPLPSPSSPPLPSPSSSSPPPPSSSSSPSPPSDGIPAQENGLGEGDVEKDNGGAATKEGHDTNAHSPGEETSSTSSSVGAKVTNDLVRGAEGGASSLPPVTPGVKNLPEPGDEVGEKNEEELKNKSINPDEIVSENFLDDVTDVINLTSLERISRKFGLTQVVIDNLKDSLRNTSPKNIGFHILQAVLKYQGCKLTFRCLLTAIRDCGNNNAADKLIATFRIDLNLEKR